MPDRKPAPTRRGPPRLAELLLERRLPAEVADAVAGDLHELHRRRMETDGPIRADLWYWGQVLSVRAGALRRAARRLAAVRPTPERNRPRCSGDSISSWSPSMIVRDLRYALRRLLATPGFTAVAVLSLALGIGANTAIFSMVDAVLLDDLPLEDPDELVELYSSDSDGFQYATSSHPDYLDVRREGGVFENVVATRSFIGRIDVAGAPRVAFGELISWDYFQTLGVEMTLGRAFLEEEDRTPGTHPVVILGHRTWTQSFGADPQIVGRSVYLNGRPYTVVGVAPEAFTGSMPVLVSSFYVPLMMSDVLMGSEQIERRGTRNLFLKARLLPGITAAQANDALRALSASLEERYPESNENRYMSVVPSSQVSIHPALDEILTPVAGLLLAVVALVLLIACANLASFLLARGEDRRREIAVRLALGAGRGRLVRQLLVETTLLALLGGLAGLILAQWTVGLILAFKPPIPVPVDVQIDLDRTVLLFTAGVSLFAGLAFGLLPALQATNPDVAPTLKGDAGGRGRGGRLGLRGGLVVTQVAFSFVLLIGAGLFTRSLQKAQAIDPGFDTSVGALVWPMPQLSGYDTDEEVRSFFIEYGERLLAHPRVTGVAMADRLPLGTAVQTGGYLVPGVPSETPDGDHDIDDTNVRPGYFDAMGVEIVAGRAFQEADVDGAPVVIVSRAFVDRFYPGEDVVGRAIQTAGGSDLRIVGVAADTKVRTLGEPPRPYVYRLWGQRGTTGLQVVVKGDATSDELVAVARETLDEVSPEMVLFEPIKTMDEHLALLLFPPRMAAMVLSVFGGLALLLAAIGVYGVVSWVVARGTREMGIRMSLGATARDVMAMAVGRGMRLVGVGALIGVVLAVGVTWAVSSYLFGISSRDVVTFAVIPLVLTTVAFVAAWIPARRASRVDPVRALRSE